MALPGQVGRKLPGPPSLEMPAPEYGGRDTGLDLLNLLLAGSGSAYGAFIPVYLASHAWTQTHIGMALTVGTVVSMLCQVPAGMIVDALGSRRRRILAVAILASCITPLLFAWMPRSASSAMEFFSLPVNRVIELGDQIEI